MEIDDNEANFVRTNRAYRDFMKRFFGFDLEETTAGYPVAPFGPGSGFMQMVRQCCSKGNRAFFDETMPDGSIIHSFARRVGTNPVTGKSAAAIAVLSVTEPNEGTTYASIARALAADYYNIYYIDLDTDKFIEYTSPVGGEALAVERHGERFFDQSKRDTMTRIYEEDREQFLASFTKENIIRELDEQGVFTITYRLIDSGEPKYANMKITRMRAGGNQIIMGVSIIDSQMKHRALFDKMQRGRDVLARVMALSENYLTLYSIEPETGRYIEYATSGEYESLGLAKEGEDFFGQSIANGKKVIYEEDLPNYLERLTEENVKREIEETGTYKLQYRLMINGEPRKVSCASPPSMRARGSPRATPYGKRGLRAAICGLLALSLPAAGARQKAAKKQSAMLRRAAI